MSQNGLKPTSDNARIISSRSLSPTATSPVLSVSSSVMLKMTPRSGLNLKIKMDEDEKKVQMDASEELQAAASSSIQCKIEEKDEKDCKSSIKKEDASTSKTPTPGRSSPEPICPICLEQIKNKAFAEPCRHMFCFECLTEWSRVTSECPLCKMSFKKVRCVFSSKEGGSEQYTIINKSAFETERYRGCTGVTPEEILERFQSGSSDKIESEIASHRMRYAPHSVNPVTMHAPSQSVSHVPCSFRRRVYNERLFVRRQPSDQERCISPAFFRENVNATQRLLPWLNRELLVVMPNNESQISFVIELIMSLILKYNIKCVEFYIHIEPFIGDSTYHFIREFYNFAASTHETMETYDQHVQYKISSEPLPVVSSPYSDTVYLKTEETSEEKKQSSESERKEPHCNKKKHIMKSKAPLDNSANSSAEDESNDIQFLGDEECQVIDEVKPKCGRTPEIVNMLNEDEKENVKNEPPPLDDDSCLSMKDIDPLPTDNTVENSSDEDIIFVCEIKATEKPIDFSMKIKGKEVSETNSKKKETSSDSSSCSPVPRPKKRTAEEDSSTESCSKTAYKNQKLSPK